MFIESYNNTASHEPLTRHVFPLEAEKQRSRQEQPSCFLVNLRPSVRCDALDIRPAQESSPVSFWVPESQECLKELLTVGAAEEEKCESQ